MLFLIRVFIAFLTAYFFGRIIYCSFCNPKEKHNIISKMHSFFLGLGFTSIFFWFFTIAANGYNSSYYIIEILLVVVIYLYKCVNKKKRLISLHIVNYSGSINVPQKKRLLINYLVVILFCFIALLCYVNCFRYPDGRWDAMAMWSFRAKFLALGNEEWNRMYFDAFDYSHRDYPLFLPCIIARCYNYMGKIDSGIPLFFSWFFTFISFILVYLYLYRLKNKYYSVLAVCTLAYSPQFIHFGSMQYADVPLAVFILISLYEFIVWNMRNSKNQPWIGMLFAALCFWIKNEGIPWFICYSLLIFYCLYKKEKNLISSIKYFFKLIILVLPVFISVLFVRYFANSENDLVFGICGRLNQLFDFERYEMIMPFVGKFFQQHYWILIILVYLLASFIDKRYEKFKYLLFVILFMYLVFIFVYLITPHDLKWHLDMSFFRITIIYLPSLIFLGCLLFGLKITHK
ncbi:MAG: glycosyltransferase family 39 protein [Candidatus Riflebacteria bacterium]|nr:glycosyltransferase family 39 protein [Candidatus Riflebacteria bacterium]